ncbi:hypothetical protein JXA88_07825 [Candidatus Fermentibacteria bacterium]|nr:hypothetical protein [Candidatus Fermentibacteria bacterium]
MFYRYFLGPGDPDPFSDTTTIPYGLPWSSDVMLEVCDGRGRRIRLLVNGTQDAGEYSVSWNGEDDAERAVDDGIYRSRLTAHDAGGRAFIHTRTITLRRHA